MQPKSDAELLREYAKGGGESAFAELVARHTNLVYSAALRQAESGPAAAEITQSVFVDLARRSGSLAPRLSNDASLAGWLCRSARNQALNFRRNEFRRQARERLAMEQFLPSPISSSAPSPDWERLRPVLDEAMAELPEPDYDAIVLRFFQNQDLRTVGRALGVSDDTAQKRVSRALDKLRDQLTKRAVTTTAAALSLAITANAVHAAPAGLIITISAATAVTGSALASTTATVTKTIAMTALQKTLIAAAALAAVGTGVYEAHQASTWEGRARTLQVQQSANANQLDQLQRERDEAVSAQTALQQENQRLTLAAAEVPKLRGDLARIRAQQPSTATSNAGGLDPNDPAVQRLIQAKAMAEKIGQYLEQMPEKKIPEIQFLDDRDWFNVSHWAKFGTEAEIRNTLSRLRGMAKNNLPLGRNLHAFVSEHNGQLPTDLSQLKPYFTNAVTDSSSSHWRGITSPQDDSLVDSILARYELLHTGSVKDYPAGTWFIAEKAPVDKEYDTRMKAGPGTSTLISTGLGEAGDPDDKSY
jgi:RNA polymerase sigma factor (sigma-70 family)